MMKKQLIFILLNFVICISTISPQDARRGYSLPTVGTFRIFVVFAEAIGDPNYNQIVPGWTAGELPENPNNFIDSIINSNYESYISRYYKEISFDSLNVIGDYYPYILKIPYSSATYSGVFSALKDSCNGQQILTFNKMKFPNDFDVWDLNGLYASNKRGRAKEMIPDGFIDCIFIFWRVNSRLGNRNGGQFYLSGWLDGDVAIANKQGISTYGFNYSDDNTVFQHEFAHGLVGPNEFHSAPQNGGTAMFIEDYPGFSILSGNGRYNPGHNGWDRYRLGWQHPSQAYEISARDENESEKDGNLIYGQYIGDSAVYVLRDFASTNDAVRIKLPYLRTLNPQAREQ